MNDQGRDSSPAAGAIEFLSVARFQEELRRAAPRRSSPLIANPLDAAVKKIVENPAFTQSRLLARVLTALTYQQGEFRRAEIAAFDSETLAMVVALMDARAAGASTREAWIGAVEQVNAAQHGAAPV